MNNYKKNTIERKNESHESIPVVVDDRTKKRALELALHRLQARFGFQMSDPRRKHYLKDEYGNE